MVEAPSATAWRELADIARHVEWMADAASIRFVGDQRTGVGTRFDCLTRVGPFRTVDRMEVVGWTEGREIAVRHQGLVTGEGRFTIQPVGDDDTSFVSWSERLSFPWYLGGPLTALLARPVLRRLWRANLHRFAALVEAEV